MVGPMNSVSQYFVYVSWFIYLPISLSISSLVHVYVYSQPGLETPDLVKPKT